MQTIALARLLRLASPALPVGAFSYSQALEWAVESAAVSDENGAHDWFHALLTGNQAQLELPMLARLRQAWSRADRSGVQQLDATYLATRETAELLAETQQMGKALRAALAAGGEFGDALQPLIEIDAPAFPTAFAYAGAHWEIEPKALLTAYAWSWLENQVTAAIKLVPLGQSAGQRLLARLTLPLDRAVDTALALEETRWSNFSPLYAIASCRHETQYSRLFRS